MVRHADKGTNFQPLKYATRPHSEYRTIIHVTVQMLQPKLDGPATETWQHVADIFNHVFADDLEAQNVRLQGAKHWRDQYVHRYANSRPAEWKTICQPDAEQSQEEMVRREGYRRRIEQAATVLGIQLPASTAVRAQPGAAQTVKRKASSILERRTASGDAGGVGAATLEVHKPTKRGALPRVTEREEEEDEMAGKGIVRKGKGWAEYEGKGDDDKRGETYEERFNHSLPDQGPRLQTIGYPAPYYTHGFGVPQVMGTSIMNGYGGHSIAEDEALARSLQEEEGRERRRKPDAEGATNYISTSSDEEELPASPAPIPKPSAKRLRYKPAGVTFEQMRRGEAQRRKTVDQLPVAAPKTLHSTKAEGERTKSPPPTPDFSDLSASPSTTSTRSAPPPLPMVHGGARETHWIDGIPHAYSIADNGQRPAAILRPSSVLTKRGGKVMRGVLDEKEQDVMLCLVNECSWCDPNIANSTVGSTTRKSLNKPLVHSCCVKQDKKTGVEKFVQDDGVKLVWEERFPNHVRSGKVEFSDGVPRDVFVCVEERCKTCGEIKAGGEMEK